MHETEFWPLARQKGTEVREFIGINDRLSTFLTRLEAKRTIVKRSQSIEKLLSIMECLRDPKTGCPWDIEQNFKTIAPYTIEEAYEVAEAIEQDNMPALKGELGDLLFQVVFHAKMAQEQQAFNFEDVVYSIVDKLTRRHPHVFDGLVIDKEELSLQWGKA